MTLLRYAALTVERTKEIKRKLLKIFCLSLLIFFKSILGVQYGGEKKRGKKIFIFEILDKKVLSYQEKKCISSMLKETLIN